MDYSKKRGNGPPPLEQRVAAGVRMVAPRQNTSGTDTSGGTWQNPKLFGTYSLWVDATGDLRIKSTAPTSDLEGTVVGTQS